MYKQDLALNNLQGFDPVTHNQPTNQPTKNRKKEVMHLLFCMSSSVVITSLKQLPIST